MRKIIVFIAIILIGCLCVFSYLFGFDNGVRSINASETNTFLTRIDYPLIDVSFDENSDWLVINRTDLFTEKEKFYISQNVHDLQMNKEYLKTLTFPIGKGTTPTGIIYVYQDGQLFKEIPYIEMSYETETIKKSFKHIAKDDIEELIKSPLPSPI